jgi:hypothetical protein
LPHFSGTGKDLALFSVFVWLGLKWNHYQATSDRDKLTQPVYTNVMRTMDHPWLEIPIADYEAHMALPSIGQARLLSTTLQQVVSAFQPRSLAVLGVAGGNGLDVVDAALVRRVVAIDFNPDYLDLCAKRHAASFAQFETILHDLSQGPPVIVPVECLYAGLLLEYLRVPPFAAYLPSLLTSGGIFAALVQLPSPDRSEVSVSPFPSLRKLHQVFSFVDVDLLRELLTARGFSVIEERPIHLASGKSFCNLVAKLA